jgi:hypothetical protein
MLTTWHEVAPVRAVQKNGRGSRGFRYWIGPAVLLPPQPERLGRGSNAKHAMSAKLDTTIAVIGIDIGKNAFHVVGLDERGAFALRRGASS